MHCVLCCALQQRCSRGAAQYWIKALRTKISSQESQHWSTKRSAIILLASGKQSRIVLNITALFQTLPTLVNARLFGSVGSGISLVTSDSDIDLALLFPDTGTCSLSGVLNPNWLTANQFIPLADSGKLKGSRQQGLHALNKIAEGIFVFLLW